VTITCPTCGRAARRVQTQYGARNMCCDLWSWDDAPLVDRATHEARKAAHEAFDRLWKHRYMRRGEAYRRLAEALGISQEECHMKTMDAMMARRAVAASEALLKEARQSRR
jgi:hypothetical protein